MNRISSFKIKQEWLRWYPINVYKIKDADVEAQLDREYNSHIFIKKRHFYAITYMSGEITQVTGDIG